MSTPGTITHRIPLTGADNPAFQVSKTRYNDSLIVASAAPNGAVLVRDTTQADGWGFTVLPAVDLSGVVPTTRTVNGHALAADVTVTAADLGLAAAVLTTSSYANPAWIASLAGGKVTGTVAQAAIAAAALVLATPRTINGIAFDGSADIVLPAGDLSGVVPTSRTVNGHALTANVTVTKDDVGLALVENTALSTWPGSAALVTVGPLATLTVTAPIVGSVTGASSATTGNAATATALQTGRAINGVTFDGTAPITVTAAAGTLTGTTLAATIVASSLTSVGTLATLTVTAPIVGSVTGASSSTTGNAATATKLTTARAINGIAFDGSAAITVTAAAGTLTGTTIAAGVTGAPQTWTALQTFSGGAAITGVMTTNVDAIALASTDGSILRNATPATAAVTVQLSPRARLSGTAWSSTAGVSATIDFFSEVLPATATVAGGSWRLGYMRDNSAPTYPLTLTKDGGLTLLQGITIAPTGAFSSGSSTLRTPFSGHLSVMNGAESFGVRLKVDALPTIASGFGTAAAITAGSTPLAGSINVGTGGVATSGVIAFGGTAFPAAPFVVCMNTTTGAVVRATATTTQLTITGLAAFAASDVIAWICVSSK